MRRQGRKKEGKKRRLLRRPGRRIEEQGEGKKERELRS